MMVTPDGSAETFDTSIGWVALNVAHPIEQWANAINRAQARNIKVIPWIRLAHASDSLEVVKQRLRTLVDTARIWGTDIIMPNYEDEADRITPHQVAIALEEIGWTGDVGWSTQAWLPNGPDWTALTYDPVLLQIFPTDNGWPSDYATIKQKMEQCVWHARNKGFTYVGVTYQTYAGATPALYDCASCMHSVYPGNQLQAGDWPQWFQ